MKLYFCSIIKDNRILADFYIPRLSTDMKIAVQKNHLGGQILYRNLDPSKKRRQKENYVMFVQKCDPSKKRRLSTQTDLTV